MTVKELLIEALLKSATFEIDVEPEDATIEGNCSAVDPATDAETAAWIRSELEAGNVWAWAYVRVRATFEAIQGRDTLGCCSYRSRADFLTCGYYEDMKRNACDSIANTLIDGDGDVDNLLEVYEP
jgi:hypothetical protein